MFLFYWKCPGLSSSNVGSYIPNHRAASCDWEDPLIVLWEGFCNLMMTGLSMRHWRRFPLPLPHNSWSTPKTKNYAHISVWPVRDVTGLWPKKTLMQHQFSWTIPEGSTWGTRSESLGAWLCARSVGFWAHLLAQESWKKKKKTCYLDLTLV